MYYQVNWKIKNKTVTVTTTKKKKKKEKKQQQRNNWKIKNCNFLLIEHGVVLRNIGARSWQYRPNTAMSVQKNTEI